LKTNCLILIAVLLITVTLAGCPPKPTAPVAPPQAGTPGATTPKAATPPPSSLTGTIRISGAFALYPMVTKWKESFVAANPGVKIDVSGGGAGKGATDALGGLVEIGMVSRAIHDDEVAKGGWWVPVCKDAVFPTMNEKNPLAQEIVTKGVTQKTLAGIWITQTVTKWSQVAGQSDKPIHIYTRSDACGAAETWAKYLAKKKQEDLKGTGVYGDPGLAESVRKDPLAIGFNNLNYAYDASTGQPVAGIRIVPIDKNGNGKLDPDESFYGTKDDVLKAIADGRYPSPPARDLNFLCKGKPSGVTVDFIKYCLTQGQAECTAAGYIALPEAKTADALKKLQ
jgi:phosphate transport system substrate-binding protein